MTVGDAADRLVATAFRVTRQRGEFFESDLAPYLTATIHTSAILRAPDEISRENEFVRDMRRVAEKLSEVG